MESWYVSAITDDERDRLTAIRHRITGGQADPDDLGFAIRQIDKLRREVDDLSVLYTCAVENATLIENELYQRNAEVGEFLTSMNHELRTPLNAVIGYAELVLEVATEEGYAPMLQPMGRVASAGRHLISLINDVLDLSKIEAGHLQLMYESVDVARLIQEVSVTLQPLAGSRGNQLAAHAEPGTIEVDKTRLRQCLINLVGNACKFTEAGVISINAAREMGSWRFDIRDTGVGMTVEQSAEVFRPFRQATAGTSLKYGGTGLGLTITHRLVTALDGEIAVQSSPGEGSTFTVRLPNRPISPGT